MKFLASLILSLGLIGASQAQVNTVYGQQAAASEQSSAYISVFGYQSLYACTYCYGTTAIGASAMRVASGYYNTAIGFNTMLNATSGSYNTAVGTYSLYNLGTGSNNVAIGYYAGGGATVNGSNNVWINNEGLAKDNNVIRIGTQGTQVFTQIAGIRGKIIKGGQAVVVSATGQLGVAKTTVVPNVDIATQDDIASLRQDLAATKNMIYALQRQVAATKTAH